MPRSKDIRHYPPAFLDYTERAGIAGEKIIVEVTTSKEGWRLRGSYYAFIGALRKQAEECETKGDRSAEGHRLMELARVSYRVMVYLAPVDRTKLDGAWTATWQNRENSWQEQLLQGAVIVPDTNLQEIQVPEGLRALVTPPIDGDKPS